MKVTEKPLKVIEKLKGAGYEGYIVGGFVRDSLLGREADDADIATSARVDEILEIFSGERVLDTGLKHGTVFLVLDGEQIEVTTFRVDGEYRDGRHPEEVYFTESIEEDLGRRDFTINAMAYDGKKIIDPFGGQIDIKRKVIKAVGDPFERFREDALRMLRAVRFASVLGFDIDERTFNAIRALSGSINKVSCERIRCELDKILLGDNVKEGIELLESTGLLRYIIPELDGCVGVRQFNRHHTYDVFGHTTKALDYTDKDLVVRLAVLLHDVAKPLCMRFTDRGEGVFYGHEVLGAGITEGVLKRLRYDKNTVKRVVRLIKNHMCMDIKTKKGVKRLIARMEGDIERLIGVMWADVLASSMSPLSLARVVRLEGMVGDILSEKEPLRLKDLCINGNDLIELGFSGKEVGDVLYRLLEDVLENPEDNKREILIKKAAEFREGIGEGV